MNLRALLSLYVFIALLTVRQVNAEAAVVKLGTVAPKGSSYHKTLTALGTKWSQVDGGARLRVYPGGTIGGESGMVQKMRINQLDAALLTSNGLADIDSSVQSLQCMPMMFHSLDEVDYVTEKLRPRLDKRLRAKGFVMLFWLDVGWVRFFSKSPVNTPSDLKKMKLFTWSGDTQTFDIYKLAGFNPVALETNDILPMLRTGMITAVPSPPGVALFSQTYTAAPNMLALNWAPLAGGLVITERAWNKFPPAAQAKMVRAAQEIGVLMKQQSRAESDNAVAAMEKRGLRVSRPTPSAEAEWRRVAESSYSQIRGRVVPAEFFDEVQRLLGEYRAVHAMVAR